MEGIDLEALERRVTEMERRIEDYERIARLYSDGLQRVAHLYNFDAKHYDIRKPEPDPARSARRAELKASLVELLREMEE